MASYLLEHEAVRRAVLPITVDMYHELSSTGIIPEKTELLAGLVIEKMTKDPRHSEILTRIYEFFLAAIGETYRIRKEDPLTLDDSEPEPDLAVVANEPDLYLSEHPRTARLVIEVSNRSLSLDRDKAAVYGRAGIPEYWIVNLQEETLEIHTDPDANGYREKRILVFEDEVAPAFAPDLRLRMSDLL